MAMFGDKKKKDATVDQAQEASDLFLQTMQSMANTMNNLPNMIATSVGHALNEAGVSNKGRNAPQRTVEEQQPPEVTEEDLESMSRREYLDHITEHLKSQLLEPITRQVRGVHQYSAHESRKQAFVNYAIDNPELPLYKEELKVVLERNPELSPEDAFVLAKGIAHPDKIDEVDRRIRQSRGESEEEEKDNLDPMISFFPSVGRVADDDEDVDTMDEKSAAESAWNSVFGSRTVLGE